MFRGGATLGERPVQSSSCPKVQRALAFPTYKPRLCLVWIAQSAKFARASKMVDGAEASPKVRGIIFLRAPPRGPCAA